MLDLLIIALYLLITLYVGIKSSSGIQNINNFAISDRRFSDFILISTITATWIGAESTIGISEKVFSFGLIYVIVFFGSSLNKILIANFISNKMSLFHNMISVGDIMNKFYGKNVRIITGLCGSILCIGTLALQFSAVEYLFYLLPRDYQFLMMFLVAFVLITYASFGGIKSVTSTDFFQFISLVIIIPIICNVGLNLVGGYQNLFSSLPSSHTHFNISLKSVLHIAGMFLIFAIPMLHPAIIQRMLMAKDNNQIARTFKLCALIEIPFYITMALIGLLAYYFNPELEAALSIPYLINNILPVGVRGLAIASMLSIIMSTADSVLNTAAIMIVHDVISPIKNYKISLEKELTLARIFTILVGLISILVAVYSRDIINALIIAFDFWIPVLAPLYAAIFGFKINKMSCIYSIFISIFIIILWNLYNLEDLFGVNSIIPSLASSLLTIVIADKLYKKAIA